MRLREGRRRDQGRLRRRSRSRSARRAGDRHEGRVRRARVHRRARPSRELAARAGELPARGPAPRDHHRRVRSARARQRPRRAGHPVLPRRFAALEARSARDGELVRSGHRVRDQRRRHPRRHDARAAPRSREDARPRGGHERPRRARGRSARARQARRVRRAAARRSCPARHRPSALRVRLRRNHVVPRELGARRGAGEATQRHRGVDPRGQRGQGPRRARAAAHPRHVDEHRILHRRPQPARHPARRSCRSSRALSHHEGRRRRGRVSRGIVVGRASLWARRPGACAHARRRRRPRIQGGSGGARRCRDVRDPRRARRR